MATWKKHFKPVNTVLPQQSRGGTTSGVTAINKFNSWLPEVYVGPPDRLQRYTQYELMDMDHEVSAALDTLAEFSTQPNDRNKLPFKFIFRDEATPTELQIIEKYLNNWCNTNDFSRRIFRMFRSTLLYGDQIYIRDPETFNLYWVDPNSVEKIVVNESQGKKIETYYIKNLDLNLQQYVSTSQMNRNGYSNANTSYPNAFLHQRSNAAAPTSMSNPGQSGLAGDSVAYPIDAAHIVHLSLSEGMDGSWPFGISVLEKVYKIFKQKEMLEDAMLIYRIHRAPERRVFFIDTGTMPPNKAQQYLEKIRFEVQQKRVPNRNGGGLNVVDSAYNPLSSLEDYYFSVGPDGRSSKVETLPGGEHLDQINDMLYFNNKMMRALGVPSSYLPTGPEDGKASSSDGKVGTAFIQEFRFSEKCKRYQRQIVQTLDLEFKLFLKHRGITLDNSVFELSLVEPQNFALYRQLEMYSAQSSVFKNLSDVPYLSKRFTLKKYLGLTPEEIAENEKLLLEEKTGSTGKGSQEAGLRQVGISSSDMAPSDDGGMPDEADMGDDDVGGDEDLGGDITDADVESFGED